MQGDLNNLNGRIIAHLKTRIHWQWHIRQTKAAGIWISARACHLEDGEHDVGHAHWLAPVAHVDVKESGRVSRIPTGHERD